MTRKSDAKFLFLPNYTECIVTQDASIKDGLSAISKSGALLAAIVDESGIFLGIFTDGDARRAILGGASISDSLKAYIKTNPVVARDQTEPHELRQLALTEGVREIPLLDDQGKLVDVFVAVTHEERTSPMQTLQSPLKKPELSTPVFLMAGGKGTRLRPVVNDRPKPLALVGDRPIIQTIIENASQAGIRNFFVSVNYKSELIVEHLKSEAYAGLSIDCIHESEFLGTAGCLGYLGDRWSESIVVSNADVLTNIAIDSVIRQHIASGADATCVVRPYQFQVPFGVVDVGAVGIIGIREKPVHKYLVNTGIYVLSLSVKNLIAYGEKLDMPALLQRVLDKGLKLMPYLMHEYWRDVGRPEEYALANEEYHNIFGNGC